MDETELKSDVMAEFKEELMTKMKEELKAQIKKHLDNMEERLRIMEGQISEMRIEMATRKDVNKCAKERDMKTQIRKQDDRITDSNKRLTRLEDRVRELKVDYDENKSIYIGAGAIKKLAIPK